MTTHDESPIIRTSKKRMAQGIAIVVGLLAIGTAIIIPAWNSMIAHPPAASLIRPEAPPPEESGTDTTVGTVEGLTKPAAQTGPSGGAAAPSAANATGAKAGAAAGTPLTILSGASVQGNPAFDPNPLSAKKGDTITVTNKDTLPHTVTSGTGPSDPTSAKSFDTSIIEAGATADISTASLAPGDFPYHCTVHPYMTGKLTVQ
jgi:cytochrome c oxidase subunit 2